MLLPYKADTILDHKPFANYLLIGATVFCHALFHFALQDIPEWTLLWGWSLPGLFAHMFVHADWWHVLGNMIFLFVFGNAVCSRIGNFKYLLIYLACGVVAGIGHILFSDLPAIGASGAVSAVVGMFLIMFPKSKISLIYYAMYRAGTFEIKSLWIISIWFVLDLLGSMMGMGGIAYHAHVAGYLAGFLAAIVLIKTGSIDWHEVEHPLVSPPSLRPDKKVEAANRIRRKPRSPRLWLRTRPPSLLNSPHPCSASPRMLPGRRVAVRSRMDSR